MFEHTEIPKWKLKANYLLKELVYIYQGYSKPEPLFKGQNFIQNFMEIMKQYLLDCGSPAPQAELDICIIKRQVKFAARHGTDPIFTSQGREAEWIAEAVAIYKQQFELITDNTLEMIFKLAYTIEDILATDGTIPNDYLISIEELLSGFVSNINELPVIPLC